MKNKSFLSKQEKQQIGLNVLSFVVYFCATGGKGSFWGFATFTLLSLIILAENLLSKDRTMIAIWIVKSVTYSILTFFLWSNKGEFKIVYVIMILLSGVALLVSRHFIKERAIAMWGSNISYLFAAYLYLSAVVQNPEAYGFMHICFWLVNLISYVLVIRQIKQEKIDQVRLIVPVFALWACVVYIVILLIVILIT
jgi:hypothetical protein